MPEVLWIGLDPSRVRAWSGYAYSALVGGSEETD